MEELGGGVLVRALKLCPPCHTHTLVVTLGIWCIQLCPHCILHSKQETEVNYC